MKIKEYRVIQSGMCDSLSRIISEKIKEGWQPYGSLVVVNDDTWIQAIVKYEASK